jgi:hypothetical protein
MERYIYEEPVGYEECLKVVSEMVDDVRQANPKVKRRPISTLCVSENALKNIERYTVYSFGRPV